MIGLRRPEAIQRLDLHLQCYDRTAQLGGGRAQACLGLVLLIGATGENHRAIGTAAIAKLAAAIKSGKGGPDIVQLDEPYLQAKTAEAEKFGVRAVNRALEGVKGTTALHVCFGYAAMVSDKSADGYSCLPLVEQIKVDQVSIEAAQPQSLNLKAALEALATKTIMVGVINLGDETPETPEIVADRIRKALKYISPERLIAAPDCGLKYLPRESARAKLHALAKGAAIVNKELGLL